MTLIIVIKENIYYAHIYTFGELHDKLQNCNANRT